MRLGLEHRRGHAHVAMQQVATPPERGDDVRLPEALHLRPPAGPLDLLMPLPRGRKPPASLLRRGAHRVEARVVERGDMVGEPLVS